MLARVERRHLDAFVLATVVPVLRGSCVLIAFRRGSVIDTTWLAFLRPVSAGRCRRTIAGSFGEVALAVACYCDDVRKAVLNGAVTLATNDDRPAPRGNVAMSTAAVILLRFVRLTIRAGCPRRSDKNTMVHRVVLTNTEGRDQSPNGGFSP